MKTASFVGVILPQTSKKFTQINLPYLWHFATLPAHLLRFLALQVYLGMSLTLLYENEIILIITIYHSSIYPLAPREKGLNQKCNNIVIEMFVRLDGSPHSRDAQPVTCHSLRTMMRHHFHLMIISLQLSSKLSWDAHPVTCHSLRTMMCHHFHLMIISLQL